MMCQSSDGEYTVTASNGRKWGVEERPSCHSKRKEEEDGWVRVITEGEYKTSHCTFYFVTSWNADRKTVCICILYNYASISALYVIYTASAAITHYISLPKSLKGINCTVP